MKTLTRLLAFAILTLLISYNARAQFESAVWDTLTADTLQDMLRPGGIGLNGYEEFHLAYGKARPGGGWNVYYRFFGIYSGSRPEEVVVSDRPCFGPVVDSRFSDNDYNVTILFESGSDIYACDGPPQSGPWVCRNVSNTSDPDFTPAVAWGYNYYHAAWTTEIDSEYKIAYMRADGQGQREIETIGASDLGEFGSGAEPFIVAIGDEPHIFYRGVTGFNYRIHHAYKVHPDSEWVIDYPMTSNLDDYSASGVFEFADIHLAISGNEGWGFPGRVYYTRWDSDTRQWSNARLVTGQYSATNGSVAVGYGNAIFVASCGVSGNIYDGNVYLSTDTTGSFQTQLLGNFQSVTQPVIGNVVLEFGVIVFDAPVGADQGRNVELFYYGPHIDPVGIDESPTPRGIALSCHPNPFNARANVTFTIGEESYVTLEVFDLLGRNVATLAEGEYEAGSHTATWDARGQTSGLYLVRLNVGGAFQTRKVSLLK
jgi:hypothetical protein